jgi:hypothetical protein
MHRPKEGIMRVRREFLVVLGALMLTSSALAGTTILGSLDCDKSDPRYVIPVPDREGFAFVMDQNRCAWTKQSPVAGLQPTGFVNTRFVEVTGATVRTTASGVTTYDNGDKVFTRSTASGGVKESTSSGRWTITGGTGKLRGIKGGGAYTCRMKSEEPGAGYTCEVGGEYTLPAAKK